MTISNVSPVVKKLPIPGWWGWDIQFVEKNIKWGRNKEGEERGFGGKQYYFYHPLNIKWHDKSTTSYDQLDLKNL